MSADTYAKLEEAISAHVADESEGRLLTDWYLVTAAVGDAMDQTHYTHICSQSAPHSLDGLLYRAQRRMNNEDED